MSYFHIAIAIAGAVFFYKAAEFEQRSPVAGVGLSILASGVVILLEGGMLAMVVGQLALLPLIALWRVWREDSKRESQPD